MINNHHPTIKFTEHSNKEIPFLDTLVSKEDNKLKTKVYHKKTDQKQYLHYKSCHPLNKKDAVPYGLLIRARRTCSKDKDFKTEALSIVSSLLKRGYPDKILLNSFNRAWNKSQSELLLPTQRNNRKQDKIDHNLQPKTPTFETNN